MSDLSNELTIAGYDPCLTAGDCTFDREAAQNAVDFFAEHLCLIEGKCAGNAFILEDWQARIVKNLFGWKRPDGMRRYRESFIFVPRKNGKMLALDTLIPTPDGWSPMGNLQVGDKVFGEDGKPCNIIEVSAVNPTPESYLVKFSNGEEIKACADHLWETTARVDSPGDKTSGRDKRPLKAIRNTKRLFETQYYGKRQDRNHSIEVAKPLDLPTADLQIHPYVMGCWLGDGDSDCARVTIGEQDVKPFMEIYPKCGVNLVQQKTTKRAARFRLDGHIGCIQSMLREAKLLKNKRILNVYLRSSIEQRTELLQGLMDTDGHISKSGKIFEYTGCNKRLVLDVKELITSLGIKCTMRTEDAKLNGRIVGKKHRVQFCAFRDEIEVFKLPRKINRMLDSNYCRTANRCKTIQIASVERINPVPMKCIAVDNESHLYLCGNTMIPTHNTPFVAGIINYVAFCDGEPGAQIYSAAGEREQAALVFRHASGMINRNEELASRTRVYRTYRSIEYYDGDVVYKALSADSDTKHGLNAHMVINDELHVQPNRDLVDTLETATASRTQPLILHITTAGFDKSTICYEKYDYAVKVREGTIDNPYFLPVLFEALETDDWTSEETWKKANPNLGVSVEIDYIRQACKEAQQIPAKENTFKRLHLNIWTEQDVRWISSEKWEALAGEIKSDIPCFAGLDMSTTTDLSAFSLLFQDGSEYYLKQYFFAPKEKAVYREKKDGVPYLTWAKNKHLDLTDGDVVDYDYVRDRIIKIGKQYNIRGIAIDRWNTTQLMTQLDGDGFDIIPFGQGFASMSGPSKKLEELVLRGTITHDNNPCMNWCMSNVAIKEDTADNIKPIKSGKNKRIDGVVSLIMALGLSIQAEILRPSVYETRGVLTL